MPFLLAVEHVQEPNVNCQYAKSATGGVEA
jgi:hypothetical protein